MMYPAGISIIVAELKVALEAVFEVLLIVVTFIVPPLIATLGLIRLAMVTVLLGFIVIALVVALEALAKKCTELEFQEPIARLPK